LLNRDICIKDVELILHILKNDVTNKYVDICKNP